MENSQSPTNSTEGESLEGPADGQAPAASATTPAPGSTPDGPKPKKKKAGFFSRFSIYLLLFGFVLFIAVMVVVISYLHSHTKTTQTIKSENLSQTALNQLSSGDVTVGDAKQVLNVQSNAVFAGQVLIRSDLQVAGKIQVGGGLTISTITVSGPASIDSAQVNKNLQVAGDSAFQGQVTVQKSLSVAGGATFGGAISAPQITTSNLQLNGDVAFTHHLIAGGPTPTRTPGNALGGGGTASVGGSDTAGSITINTGSAPSSGCLVTVTFTTKYQSPPHVVISPTDAGAGSIGYYATITTSGFSVCANNAPGAGQSFGFDYIVFD